MADEAATEASTGRARERKADSARSMSEERMRAMSSESRSGRW